MGLHEEVPPDPPGRARHFGGLLLHRLKQELSQAQVLQVSPQELIFERQHKRCRLWMEGDLLCLEGGGARQEILHIGDQGRLCFRRAYQSLHIEVHSWAEPLHPHSFCLRLPLAD